MSHKTDPLKSLLDVQRHMIKKSVPDAPNIYDLQENKSYGVFFLLSYVLYYIGDKITAGFFKIELHPF